MPSNEPKPYEYWIVVVELEDVVERRDPSKPNLRLEVTRTHPLTRFDRLKRSKRKTWYLGFVQKLREDLMPKSAFPDRVSAIAALKLIRAQLNKDGYTVNRYTRVWQVYVLELDSTEVRIPAKDTSTSVRLHYLSRLEYNSIAANCLVRKESHCLRGR